MYRRPERRWGTIVLVSLLGVSNIGLINTLISKSKFPVINLPVGPYTTYQVDASEFGYKISYMANDPKVLNSVKRSETPKGFFGNKKEKILISKEFTMNGEVNSVDSSQEGSKLTDKEIACYKVEGSGESTGRLVGASMGVKAAPAFTNIPIIGWLAAGWVTMFSQDKGADVGGSIAREFNDC